MLRRSLSDRTRDWLLSEMSQWQSKGILTGKQASQILELYETPAEVTQRKYSLAIFVLMVLSSFLVGLAALLLIGYNWEAMPKGLKLSVIFGVILGTYGLAFHLRYRRKARLLSEAVFFLACFFYGCGIWLVAQVFHIQSHYPNGLWLWALGVLPFALCLDTLALHALLVSLLATWVGTEVLGFGLALRPWFFGRWFALPGACYSLPLLALPGLFWAYRKRAPATVALYVPLLAWWAILQPVAWGWEVYSVYFAGTAGAILLACAECHPTGSPMAVPYRFFGVLTAGGVLVPLSFADFISEMLRSGSVTSGLTSTAVLVVLAGVAIPVADLVRQRGPVTRNPTAFSAADFFRRQWLPLGITVLMASLCLWNGFFGAAHTHARTFWDHWNPIVLLPTLAANVAMVVFAVWLMRVGLREDRGWPFTAGVLYFLLWAVLRYVDLFAGVGGMLGASLMFFLCGAGLFGVARFWMHRKEFSNA